MTCFIAPPQEASKTSTASIEPSTPAPAPAVLLQPDPCISDDNPFGHQKRTLHRFVTAVTAELPAGGNHAMRGDVGPAHTLHDVADGSGSSGPSCHGGHIAICRDATRGNAADN